jgi:cobalt-zinc-cadmium efflux system outer membrane protein
MRICRFITLCLSLLFAGCAIEETSTLDTIIAPTSQKAEPAGNDSPREFVPAEPNGILTLRQALALTLMHNSQLKVFSWETRAAEARELRAGLWPNPELGVEVEDVGGSGPRSGFDAAETTIQLSQLIELGDKAQKRKQVAALEKELAGWDYQAKRLEVLKETGKAYLSLLVIQEKTKLLAELVDVSEQTLRSVSLRVDAGKDSPLEKTKASVALSEIRIEHRQALQELENARKYTASFWGSRRPQFSRAEGRLETVFEIPEINQLQQKLLNNPMLAWWEKEIARNKAALELEKSKSVLDVSVSAGVKRFNETDDNAIVFGVAIPLPVSDRNQGGRMEAVANLSKSHEAQRAARIEILNQFNHVYNELSISLTKTKELHALILPGAEEVFNASREAYKEGKVDYLNVLDAQRTYFEVRMQYIDVLAAYHNAVADMECLIGQEIESKANDTEVQ